MSDKSLPKPVPLKDPVPKVGGGSQMPPSARVQAPVPDKKTTPATPSPISSPVSAKSLPQSTSRPLTPPPATMKPPVSASRPPVFSGRPPQLPGVGSKPGVKQPTPNPLETNKKPNSPTVKSPTKNKDSQKKSKTTFATVKESPFKYLPFIIGGLILIGIIWFVISKLTSNSSKSDSSDAADQVPVARKTVPAEQISLIYWGLWEPDNAVRSTLDKFEEANPGVKISYVKQSHQDYRERLQTAVSSGNGPDIFRYHASWTPMLSEELSSMPQSVMTANEYQQIFYPVAAKMLNIEGQIVGIPLMYEGLGLYYNKEMMTAANSEPPSTWAEVKILANKLTVRDGNNLKRGGVAIGNASNVEHFADILGLLMLQNGADPADPSSKEAQDALAFYTNFVKEDRVWDDKLPSSTVAFARGDVAMMLAPSWRAHEVKTINPNLAFGIVPVPRLGDDRLAWASFWAEGVSSKSKNKDKSWELLKFLSSKEIQQELYNSQSKIRPFGEIYSRVDLANDLAGDELVSPFLEDAPAASSWYLSSYTHDNGINDLLIKYYQDAINAVLNGESIEKALETVTIGTKQILRQYGVE